MNYSSFWLLSLWIGSCLVLSQAMNVTFLKSGTSIQIPDYNVGKYFGVQNCDNMNPYLKGILVPLATGENLCNDVPLTLNPYKGNIILIPGIGSPLTALNTSGCTREHIYEKVYATGAIGIVSFEFGAQPGLAEFYIGYRSLPNSFYESLIFKSISYNDFNDLLLPQYQAGEMVYVSLACELVHNPFYDIMIAISYIGFAAGFSNLLLAGITWARIYEIRGQVILGGQRGIMIVLASFETLLGIARLFGCTNIYAEAIMVSNYFTPSPPKGFFTSGLMGFDFFTTFLLAVFWWEMGLAARETRKMENIFTKYWLVLVVGLAVAMVPDLFVSVSFATFTEGWGIDNSIWVYSALSMTVSIFFLVSFRYVIVYLRAHDKNLQSTGVSGVRSNLRRLTYHMIKWLIVYTITTVASVICYIVLFSQPAYLIRSSTSALLILWIVIYSSTFIQMLSKIMAIRGPSRRSKPSMVTKASIDIDPMSRTEVSQTFNNSANAFTYQEP